MTSNSIYVGRWRALVVSFIAVMCPSACTSWHIVEPAPAEYLKTHRPREIELTRNDSSKVTLRTPDVRGDTLFGTVGGGLVLADTAHVAIPISDVRTLAVRGFSLGKTLGLYLLITIPLAIIGCSGGGGYVC